MPKEQKRNRAREKARRRARTAAGVPRSDNAQARQRRASRSSVQREQENEARRHQYHNQLNEQREERNEARRLQYHNLSNEQRQERNEARRHQYHSISDEQREERNSYVAQLDFSLTEMPSDELAEGFKDFENNPETAALLWHMNSGLGRFRDVDNLPDPQAKARLKDEIDSELVTQQVLNRLEDSYLHARSQDCDIYACGTCGC
jgi:hypothetical protein